MRNRKVDSIEVVDQYAQAQQPGDSPAALREACLLIECRLCQLIPRNRMAHGSELAPVNLKCSVATQGYQSVAIKPCPTGSTRTLPMRRPSISTTVIRRPRS